MVDNILLFKHLTQFKEWLVENRKGVFASLRKYNVARSYLIMAALATIFTLAALSISNGGQVSYYLVIAISVCIILSSDKIAYYASGLSKLNSLPLIALENETNFLKDIEENSSAMDVDLTLVDRRILKAAIYGSSRGKIKLALLLSACIEIVDLIESSE